MKEEEERYILLTFFFFYEKRIMIENKINVKIVFLEHFMKIRVNRIKKFSHLQ